MVLTSCRLQWCSRPGLQLHLRHISDLSFKRHLSMGPTMQPAKPGFLVLLLCGTCLALASPDVDGATCCLPIENEDVTDCVMLEIRRGRQCRAASLAQPASPLAVLPWLQMHSVTVMVVFLWLQCCGTPVLVCTGPPACRTFPLKEPLEGAPGLL